MKSDSLVLPEAQELVEKEMTPLGLLSVALRHSAGIDVIERLTALQERAMARDSEMQFNEAMTAAQSELGRVAPDLTNPQTHSRYASYAALDRKIRPVYTKHGFSLSFNSGDSPMPDTVRVECFVSHRAGHTRKYLAPPMPSDGKGAKGGDVMTKTHATGSAMSYGARYLLKFIFNISVGEEDNDGNSDSGMVMDGDYIEQRIQDIMKAESLNDLWDRYKVPYKEAMESGDKEAQRRLLAAKDAKKKDFLGKAAS